MKKWSVIAIALTVFFSLLIAACNSTATTSIHHPNTIKLGQTDFGRPSITIKKGETITFDDSNNGGFHILTVGKDGDGQSESGAPDFGGAAGHRTEIGDVWTTPPFATAGTFHITCTVHPFMNLTVKVTS